LAYEPGNGWDDCVSEGFESSLGMLGISSLLSVQPDGNPISHSIHGGFGIPPS